MPIFMRLQYYTQLYKTLHNLAEAHFPIEMLEIEDLNVLKNMEIDRKFVLKDRERNRRAHQMTMQYKAVNALAYQNIQLYPTISDPKYILSIYNRSPVKLGDEERRIKTFRKLMSWILTLECENINQKPEFTEGGDLHDFTCPPYGPGQPNPTHLSDTIIEMIPRIEASSYHPGVLTEIYSQIVNVKEDALRLAQANARPVVAPGYLARFQNWVRRARNAPPVPRHQII